MENQSYNLLDRYVIAIINDKIYWTEAVGLLPYEEGFDDVDLEQFRSLIVYGKGELIDGILVLYSPNGRKICAGDYASRFYLESIATLPKWTETECYVRYLYSPSPSIKYCNKDNEVPPDYAFYVIDQLGYSWESFPLTLDKKDPEINPAA